MPVGVRPVGLRDVTGQQRRVLVLLNGVVDTFGGNLRAAVNIAEAMAGDGTHVTFSAPVVSGAEHRTIDLMDHAVRRRLFPATPALARFGGSVRQAVWLARHVRDFDEVQTHSLFSLSAVYSIVMSSLRGVTVVLWPHGSLDPFDLRKHAAVKRVIGPVVVRPLLNRCAALLFTTDRESQIAVTYGSRTPHEVVALPVEPVQVADPDPSGWRRRHGVPSGVPVVLFLGRIDYKKRLPLLVEAMALVSRKDAQLVVVGDGPDSERRLVTETVGRCGLTERVHLTGWLEGDDRREAFAIADVFALLSDAENFGLSLVEALSAGCPVVVSDQVDLAERLEQAGAAVRVERDAALAAHAIDAILSDPAAAAELGRCGRAFVVNEFAPAAVAARLREVSKRRAVAGR